MPTTLKRRSNALAVDPDRVKSTGLDDLVTTADLCARFKVVPKTITRWIQAGLLSEPRRLGRKSVWTQAQIKKDIARLTTRRGLVAAAEALGA